MKTTSHHSNTTSVLTLKVTQYLVKFHGSYTMNLKCLPVQSALFAQMAKHHSFGSHVSAGTVVTELYYGIKLLQTRVSKPFVLYVLITEAEDYCPSWIMFNWRRPILTSLRKHIKKSGGRNEFCILCSKPRLCHVNDNHITLQKFHRVLTFKAPQCLALSNLITNRGGIYELIAERSRNVWLQCSLSILPAVEVLYQNLRLKIVKFSGKIKIHDTLITWALRVVIFEWIDTIRKKIQDIQSILMLLQT